MISTHVALRGVARQDQVRGLIHTRCDGGRISQPDRLRSAKSRVLIPLCVSPVKIRDYSLLKMTPSVRGRQYRIVVVRSSAWEECLSSSLLSSAEIVRNNPLKFN